MQENIMYNEYLVQRPLLNVQLLYAKLLSHVFVYISYTLITEVYRYIENCLIGYQITVTTEIQYLLPIHMGDWDVRALPCFMYVP